MLLLYFFLLWESAGASSSCLREFVFFMDGGIQIIWL